MPVSKTSGRSVLRWHCLGHAMGLAEFGASSLGAGNASGARVLFDPLLEDLHDGEVGPAHPGARYQTVVPGREIDAEALRPDFIVVSHAHPDHFDVGSLSRLAALDPDSIVLTADPLVKAVCERLGFREVVELSAWQRVELDHGELITTPSYSAELEWGVALVAPEGVLFNHIDSVLGSKQDLERTLEILRGAAGRPVDVHLARWCPVLEVEPQISGQLGFPARRYAEQLLRFTALGRSALCPSAVGVAPAPPYSQLGQNAFPIDRRRFVRDLAEVAPDLSLVEAQALDTLELADGQVRLGRGESGLGRLKRAEDSAPGALAELPRFVPFEVAPLADLVLGAPPERELGARAGSGSAGAELAQLVEAWLETELAPALQRMAHGAAPGDLPLRCSLDVRVPGGNIEWSVQIRAAGPKLSRSADPDYDMLVAVTGSGLHRVLTGDASWGELLLSGQLRVSDRAYRVDRAGARRIGWLPALFVYASPGYAESFERATWRRVLNLMHARRER